MSTKIGVAVRVRPLLESEKKLSLQMTKLQVSPSNKEIRVPNEDNRGYKSFKFDKVLDQNINQEQLYEQTQVQDLINKVVEGFNATIFAYGQTGSGKTYTMEGYKYEVNQAETDLRTWANPYGKDAGIIPRSIKALFDSTKSFSKTYQRSYTVYCSFLQIYNEKIYDLLNPTQMTNTINNKPGAGLRLRWTPKDQFAVENLFIFECRTAEEVLSLFHQGLKNKIMASHKLNLASSRSHCILSLRVESIDAKTSENLIASKLDLVDLAGSERASMTGNDSHIAQKESIEINKSLFTLRQVISTLADIQKLSSDKEKPHVPYRDSKLTCLLKQSIGGNSYCLMIACLAPADRYFEENLSTLTYATKAAYISNEPTKNEDPKTNLISDLKVQVSNLSKELEKANNHIAFLGQLTNEKINIYGEKLSGERKVSYDPELEVYKRPSQSRTSDKGASISKKIDIPYRRTNTTDYSDELRVKKKDGKALDPKSQEFLNERLLESINTVKELLKSNKEVREKMDKLVNFNETLRGELFQLHKENQDLREKLAVFESLFNNGGAPQTQGEEDELTKLENKINLAKLQSQSPKDKKTVDRVQELAEEVLNLRRQKKALENKVRDSEIQNITLQQKYRPSSYLLRERKTYQTDSPFQAHQYYQSLIARPTSYGQTQYINGISPLNMSRAGTVSTPPQDEARSNERLETKTDFGELDDSKRMSSPEIRNKSKQKELRLAGHYLPLLKDNNSEINNDAMNHSMIDGSLESMKKSNNVWLSGYINRRANSTLKKIKNNDRANRTIDGMNRIQMFSGKSEEI